LKIESGSWSRAANYHQTVRHLHDLGGGLALTLPPEANLRNEESGPVPT
jgi:4-hydroxybutyryl-CoA dehydratase/vinylacetyl-CoA-Delta-isomerase